jgi:hypothetical protein
MVCGGGAPFFARTTSAHVWKKVDMEYPSAAWWCVLCLINRDWHALREVERV